MSEKKQKTNLPPDPEELNDKRAEWAEQALLAFQAKTGVDMEDAVGDLLADLGHWCDRNGVSFQRQLESAGAHYDEETGGKGQQFEY